ncbi:XrtY-associated glycosyltransferase XYAG1 [Pedobacter miscanthi]|uniref:XrtY-associated glycosyltransferase XYAG1 n=1 Tax=Pedobacter miscanthi TaxID=2259170 RepID=UPI00292F6170|nr:glycosyltransferase [Pedobacter miscanthi]
MKVIHITASYKPAYIYGGPIQSVAKLCEALTGLSDKQLAVGGNEIIVNNIQVLTTTANGKKELDVKTGKPVSMDGVSVTYFKRWTKDHSHFSPQLLWTLRRKVRRYVQDDKHIEISNSKLIIHIHAWWNLVSVLSCLIAKWYKIPVILSPRGMLTSYSFGNRNSFSKKLIHKLLGKRLLKYCHIHATSEQEKQDILKIITPKSITIVPNLVNFPLSISSLQSSTDNIFRLIFLSRIEEKKGLELLFEALSLIEVPWQLIIAGMGKEEYVENLKRKAEKLKLSNKIKWFGLVSKEDKFNLMADHDLTVLTSYNENFANVVVESLSVGTPVLISKNVGLADYVADKNLGWVTGLGIEEIRIGIVSAYQDIKKRNEIRTSALKIISHDFNDDALIKKYVKFYKDILVQASAKL